MEAIKEEHREPMLEGAAPRVEGDSQEDAHTGHKTKAVLYDIADDITYNSKKNYTLNHLVERIKIYKEEDFHYELSHIKLK